MRRPILLTLATIAVLLGWWLSRRQRRVNTPAPSGAAVQDFQDLSFAIIDTPMQSDGSRHLRLRLTDDSLATLDLSLSKSWTEGRLGGTDIQTFQGVVTVQQSTDKVHNFANTLDRRYKTNLRPVPAARPTVFSAISLEGDPGRLESGPTKLKLFYEPDSEDRYAEAFLNIDLAHRVAEFAEKDMDYRANIVRAFAER